MSIHTLSSINSLKRPQLQALCKDNGIRANGKTDQLIALLVQHFNLRNKEAPDAEVEDEDEMQLAPEPVKKVSTSKGKSTALPSTSSSATPKAATTTIIERVQTIYQTSPGTKSAQTKTQIDIASLQTSLSEAKAQVEELSHELFVEKAKRDEERKEMQEQFQSLKNEFDAIRQEREAEKVKPVDQEVDEPQVQIEVDDVPPIQSLNDSSTPVRQSPAGLPLVSPALARLAKRSRDSDESDRYPHSVAGSVVSSGGGRKRLRVDESEEEDDEEEEEVVEEDESTFSSEAGDFDSSILIREPEKEYTVATKSGSSPPPPTSIHNPSFFARTSLPTNIASSASGSTNSPRKSLPMNFLPFPLVRATNPSPEKAPISNNPSPQRVVAPSNPSPQRTLAPTQYPYRPIANPSPQRIADKSPARSPARPAFFDTSNNTTTNPSAAFTFSMPPPPVPTSVSKKSNPFMATGSRPSTTLMSAMNSSPRKERPPPTPEAGRTLWGTERSEMMGFGDADTGSEEGATPVRIGAWGR